MGGKPEKRRAKRAPKRETSVARQAYEAYLAMGPGRSLSKLAAALGKTKPMVVRWSSGHDWQRRVAEHDAAVAASARKAAEEAAARASRDRITKLVKERDEFIEVRMRDARLLMTQGRYLASFPVKTETREQEQDGKPVQVTVEGQDPSRLVAGARIMAIGIEQYGSALRDAFMAWGSDDEAHEQPAGAVARSRTVVVELTELPRSRPDAG